MKKRLFNTLAISIALLTTLSTSVFAMSPQRGGIITNGSDGPVYNGIIYEPISETTALKLEGWSEEVINGGALADSCTRTISRTKEASMSTTASVDVNGMVASAGVALEVKIGVTQTVTWSYTFNIAPHEIDELSSGSFLASCSGWEQTYYQGTLQKEKSVSGKWSWKPYESKICVGHQY